MEALRRQDDARMDAFEKDLSEVRLDIRTIKENHLSHIEKDMATIAQDMEWIKRFFWVLATLAVGGIFSSLLK